MRQLQRLFWLTGVFSVVLASAAQADSLEPSTVAETEVVPVEDLDRSEEPQPATTVAAWMSQIEAQERSPAPSADIAQALTQITDVQITETENGLQLMLAATGSIAEPETSVVGNALIAEIPNAALALAEGDEFQAANPVEGIALVSVTGLPDNRVRVSITGTDAPPETQVGTEAGNLVLSVVPGIARVGDADDAIQIVVTGEPDERYNAPTATTATRTDTPLRDIPQSIQVVPRAVIEDQQATDLQEIVRNVSGVVESDTFSGTFDSFNIRGFQQRTFLRNGFRDGEVTRLRETANVERVEVLKGPASILFGRLEPGGVINLVPERPTAEPFFALEPRVGSFGFIEPSIDASGPLNADRTVRYRLNALYERQEGFRDFNRDIERFFVSPVVTWDIGDRTNLTLEFSYTDDERPFDQGLVSIGEGIADIPFDRIVNELDDFNESTQLIASYELEHEFNDNLELRNRFQFLRGDRLNIENQPFSISDAGELQRFVFSNDAIETSYGLQTNLVGDFQTGTVGHEVLFGFDLNREVEDRQGRSTDDSFGVTTINIFDPVYDDGTPSRDELNFTAVDINNRTDSLGIYLQDLIAFTDNLKLLIGGRFDLVSQNNENRLSDTTETQDDTAFSPRIGLVYQPIEPLSLYASFSRSFVPNGGDGQGGILPPERGTQYEVGLRGELLEGRLSANLAAFNITKSNIAVGVPGPPAGLQRAIGEQRSRGIELDIAGEISDGWRIIASYAHTHTEITEDNGSDQEGNELQGVPRNAASLWTTYEFQQGDLQGLGLGAGVFFVGDREGNLDNNFELPSYARVDARISYQRDNWEAALNFKNLFDIDYVESPGFGRFSLDPGIPFTVIGTFSVEF
ncbi:TonB-dependent siderophore receptor [Halomicronema hongdechloris C2206]|uniref:TonB-dependent siderophore receptor n=2 Tax=Halomicronema hongdechloris TaxID=1209493 RepID=A0A1Z3HN80_9CYAN|nr:TonB-dependent siderophore receptor [Halomicronema hongdechloris C2206]